MSLLGQEVHRDALDAPPRLLFPGAGLLRALPGLGAGVAPNWDMYLLWQSRAVLPPGTSFATRCQKPGAVGSTPLNQAVCTQGDPLDTCNATRIPRARM